MVRVQLRLQGNAEELFNSLVTLLNTEPKNVILDALGLLHFAADQVVEGKRVGSFDPESKEFTAWTTPTLESLTRKKFVFRVDADRSVAR